MKTNTLGRRIFRWVLRRIILLVRRVFEAIRSTVMWWIADQTMDHLESIRRYELDIVIGLLQGKGKVLEIGAGTGWQAQIFASRGYDVSAIDLASSCYKGIRIWPITDYDGNTIPFEDNSFDIIFSSSVLEHIPQIYEFQKEINRVLKPDGCVIHVVPSSSWRFWTNLTEILKFWSIPKVHGEHAGNALSEIFYFSRQWWSQLFRDTGWALKAYYTNELFYTGHSIMDSRLPIRTRCKLSHILGSSCHIFVLWKEPTSDIPRCTP
jgi:SAM-dependent methyltransferase